MRCTDARALLTKRLYEPLVGTEGTALDRHLSGCGACRLTEAEEAEFEKRLLTAGTAAGQASTVMLDKRRVLESEPGGLRLVSGAFRGAGLALAGAGLAGAIVLTLAALEHRPPNPMLGRGEPSQAQRDVLSPPQQRERPSASAAGLSGSGRHRAGPVPPTTSELPAGPAQRGGMLVQHPASPGAGAPQQDVQYLDGYDPVLLAEWMGGKADNPELRALLEGELSQIRVKDDFVEIALPRLAAARPGDPAVRTAIRQYEKEAEVVDARLFRKITLRARAAPLSEFCEQLEKEVGVQLRASRGVGDENVTVLVKDLPVRDVMRAVARLFGYKWSRTGEAPAYRYELYQDLRSQLAEEEMRNRDRHAALLALDEQMQEYRPLLSLTPEQIKARAEQAKGREKELLAALRGEGWSAVQMYYRLTPAQRIALANGQSLSFSTHARAEELRIPADLRKRVLESTGMSLGSFEGARAIVDAHFGAPGTPLAEIPDASATVSLHLERSELGQLTLRGRALGQLESEPGLKRMFMGATPTLARATSPSVAKPDNREANAALQRDPAFQRKVTVVPKPACPWFSPGGKPEDPEGFELAMGGTTMHFGPNGMEQATTPHVTSGEAWEALHDATGQPVVTDAYSRVYPVAKLTQRDQTAFEALCRTGDEMGMRWRKDGAFLLARSSSFFWDKLKEVPARHLRRWQEHRKKHGLLPLEDVLEMATISDAQLDARGVGFAIGHCWGLEEWGMVGSGGSFRLGLPAGSYMRKYARFLAGLAPLQLTHARQPAGLAAASLTGPQQESLLRLVLDSKSDPAVLDQLRFRVEYSPVGTFLWHPVADSSSQAEELNRKWAPVVGRTREEAMGAARRFNPMADPAEIKKSRGAFMIRFENARGDAWQEGGPGVAFRVNR